MGASVRERVNSVSEKQEECGGGRRVHPRQRGMYIQTKHDMNKYSVCDM